MKKKIVALLCCVFAIMLCAVTAFGAETVASGYCGGSSSGKNVRWTLDSNGKLSVSGTGAMADYEEDRNDSIKNTAPWAEYANEIKSISIGKGITHIGDRAFRNVGYSLGNLVIPDGVISIGKEAFEYSTFGSYYDKATLTLPNSIRSIGEYAFNGCEFGGELVLPCGIKVLESGVFDDNKFNKVKIPPTVVDIQNSVFTQPSYDNTQTAIYFGGDAPDLYEADYVLNSFDETETLYYLADREGWTSPTYEGYKTQKWERSEKVKINFFLGVADMTMYYHSKEALEFEDIQLLKTIGKYQREGKYLVGWSLVKDSGVIDFLPGENFSACREVWLFPVSKTGYEVTFDANGGTGAPEKQVKIIGEQLILDNTVPQKDGYTFIGWSSDPYAVEAEYPRGEENVYSADEEIVLYAVWGKNAVITYDANGGTGAPEPQEKIYQESLTISSTEPERKGYTFIGWSYSPRATAAQYFSGDIYTAEEDATFYAVWRKNAVITYDANGGTGAPEPQEKIFNEAAAISKVKPVKKDATFMGWASYPSSKTVEYVGGDYYKADEDITLYAVWREIYTIKYNANGGINAPSEQRKDEDMSITLGTVVPERIGYTFLGWSEDKNAESAEYGSGATYSKDKNTVLYAVWKENENTNNSVVIRVGKAYGKIGNTVSVPVKIENNCGIAVLGFGITYDKTKLKLVGADDAGFEDWYVGVGAGEKANWVNEKGSTLNGKILNLRFEIIDADDEDMIYVAVKNVVAGNKAEERVSVTAVSGNIIVSSGAPQSLPGDCNSDDVVDILDLILLRQYIAEMDVEIDLFAADVNNDDVVDILDLILLRQYIAEMDVELI